MYYQNKNKNSTIPKKWFFFDPDVYSDHETLSDITSKMGVVFFSENLESNQFLPRIQPYVSLCRQKNIKFIIPFSPFWANKYKAFGVIIDLNKKTTNNFTKKSYKKYLIVSKVHGFKEAHLAKKFVDLIFLSPAYRTTSYPTKKPLSNYIFISLCLFFKQRVIFALGGVNHDNFKFLKNKNLYGFGAINYFKKENEKI